MSFPKFLVLSRPAASCALRTTAPRLSIRPFAPSRRFFAAESKETDESEPKEEEQNPDEVDESPEATEDESDVLRTQMEAAKNDLLRSLADMENVRTIAKRDVHKAKEFAIQGFAKQLLDVSDNLGRALEAVPENASKEQLETLVEGVEMTRKELDKVFLNNGIVRYGEVGDEFDPHKYDALYELPLTEDKKAGTVGDVLKQGFTLKDRVLRPAQVGIVKKA